jgi:RNA-directed DNA polymerase
VNTHDSESSLYWAERRVLEIQTKLHRWASDDPHRRFDDVFNLVTDPAFLLVAWDRVRSNKGARTAGVDGETARYIEVVRGLEGFLGELRAELKARAFRPLPSRRRAIPKAGGKVRYLGIATIRDRVVQASLKLVLEPIFETDFLPCSSGFRPNRRAHDAVAEIHHFASRSYEWIVEGDIKACFDEISHPALMNRVRIRVGDKRVLTLVKAFLKAGILDEDRILRATDTGTPQGPILSPLLSNVALSVLDEHVAQGPGGPQASPYERAKRRRHGLPNYRLARYADDWCLLVSGTKTHAEALRNEIAEVLTRIGLRLSPEKTLITHIDEGLDFLGWRIQRHQKTRHRQTLCLHLSGQESPRRHHDQGQGSVPEEYEPTARGPAASAKPDAAGLDRVLQVRMLECDLQLPAVIPVEGDRPVAGTQASAHPLETIAPTLRHLARRWRGGAVRSGQSQRQALLLPGNTHPDTMAEHRVRSMNLPELVESPVRCEAHAGFGRRPRETHQR